MSHKKHSTWIQAKPGLTSQYQPLLSLIRLEQALNNFTRVEKLFSDAIKGPSGGITAAADIEIWSELEVT